MFASAVSPRRTTSAVEPSARRAAGRALARLDVVAGPLDTPCWVFTGGLSSDGYAFIRTGARTRSVHRFLYEILVGPIPAGLELHHRCENRACARPDHLEPVTHAENHAYTARARSTTCLNGHEWTPENTNRRGRHQTRQCRRCCRDRERRKRGLDDAAIAELERAYQERLAA